VLGSTLRFYPEVKEPGTNPAPSPFAEDRNGKILNVGLSRREHNKTKKVLGLPQNEYDDGYPNRTRHEEQYPRLSYKKAL